MYGCVVDWTGIVFVSLKQATKEPQIPRQVQRTQVIHEAIHI